MPRKVVPFSIPRRVSAACRGPGPRSGWLRRLPGIVAALQRRWNLTLEAPFDGEDVSAAWVAPATRADGTTAVLKIGMPHMEAEHEGAGLRFWAGDPTVRLLESDDALGGMLLERCHPGTPLRLVPEPGQDVVIASLLRRLWRAPPVGVPFRPLSAMIAAWRVETEARAAEWPDAGLVGRGLDLLETLCASAPTTALLATDLHAGNILRSQREPWLVIDPKPFVGDPSYDVTQHLFNCGERLRSDTEGMVARMADLAGVERERVRLWLFARAAAEPRSDWRGDWRMAVAREVAP